MTTEDFKQLEGLLGKLEIHLGARYCVIPRTDHDGCWLALYDHTGKRIRDLTGPDLQTVSGLIRIQIDKPIKK